MAYLILLYFIDKQLLTNAGVAYWAPFLLYAAVMYQASQEDCTALGRARDFREILRTPFAVFAIANAAFWVALYGLHLADPGITQLELGKQLQAAQQQLKDGLGDPQAMNELRQRIAAIEKDLVNPGPVPLGQYVFSLAIWNLFGFAISAAIAAIQRSR